MERDSRAELAGRVAVVIGGTSGIGRAIALGLARAGADVVASGRESGAVEETAAAIESLGRRTLRQTVDVRRRGTIEGLRDAVLKSFGRVDVLVNSAGVIHKEPMAELGEEAWREVLEVNLTGTFRSCQVFGSVMLRERRGCVINVSSVNGQRPFPGTGAYCVSKAGVDMLTRSLAMEWAPSGVRVNAVAPGTIRTRLNAALLDQEDRAGRIAERTPMGRLGNEEDVVGAVVFLASDAAGWTTGAVVPVDGGFLASGL